jgi:hypothetical protein
VTAPYVYFPLVSLDRIHCEIISELKCKMFREGQLEKIFGFNREESGDGLAQ